MTEVRFYHLLTQPLERALPAILNKVVSMGRKAVVRFVTEGEVKHFNEHLWTYDPNGFLPHGAEKDGHREAQPVFLTTKEENPNGADVLVLCNPENAPGDMEGFSLCCDFLNGQNDDSVQSARTRWKIYKEAGHSVTYWQQTDSGGWEQKA